VIKSKMICSGCGCEVDEHFPDFCPDCRIAELEAQITEIPTVCRRYEKRIAELEAKLDAAHNWVLNTCPEEYNQFVKALGEAK